MTSRRWGGNYTRRARARLLPLVLAGGVICPKCGLPIRHDPSKPAGGWHAGHQLDRALGGTGDPANVYAEHDHCNTSAGGQLAQAMRRAATPTPARRPDIKRRPWI